MLIYILSIMWDLSVPQEAASRLYKDNNACTAMANTQKPTTQSQPMVIHYNVLCKLVERDLVILKWVDATINKANNFTKLFAQVLFHQHIDYIMGHVPPEYSPAYLQPTGQFDMTKLHLVPDKFTTKDTMTLPISIDISKESYLNAAAAVQLYTPDYSALLHFARVGIGHT